MLTDGHIISTWLSIMMTELLIMSSPASVKCGSGVDACLDLKS